MIGPDYSRAGGLITKGAVIGVTRWKASGGAAWVSMPLAVLPAAVPSLNQVVFSLFMSAQRWAVFPFPVFSSMTEFSLL